MVSETGMRLSISSSLSAESDEAQDESSVLANPFQASITRSQSCLNYSSTLEGISPCGNPSLAQTSAREKMTGTLREVVLGCKSQSEDRL